MYVALIIVKAQWANVNDPRQRRLVLGLIIIVLNVVLPESKSQLLYATYK